MTIDDVILPYYLIAHKDYTGIRYGDDFKNVVGIDDYHDGKTDTISGLKRVDDYTLEVTYKTFSASMKQVGGDPNPSGFYGKTAPFNYERWSDDKNEELLKAISSDEAFDEAFRKQAFHDWQAYTNEVVPAIPYLYRYGIRSVNNRVKHYDVSNGSGFGLEQLELTADEPIK